MMLSTRVPSSKSMTQRALVIAALADGPTRLRQPLRCDDSRHLVTALRALGAGVEADGDDLLVEPASLRGVATPIYCGNAGTTLRFICGLSLCCRGEVTVDGDDRMRARPIGPLGAALRDLGCEVDDLATAGYPPLRVRAPREPAADVTVDARISSQFASGLLLAAPRLARGLRLTLRHEPVSRSYLEMTTAMMRAAGARLRWTDEHTVAVEAGRYRGGRTVDVEPDWSSAAVMLAAGALLERPLHVDGLPAPQRSVQGDARFVAVIAELARDRPHVIDLVDTPDLIGPATALALFRTHPTRIEGIAHTRHKESDRPRVLTSALRALGANVRELPGALEIAPLDRSYAARDGGRDVVLDPRGDHRMAMTFGLLSLRLPGITVLGARCVSKSFPDFWQELARLRSAAGARA